jgi:hypothetical protein
MRIRLLFKSVSLVITLLYLQSCAFHTGSFSSGPYIVDAQTVAIGKGIATTHHFLGIGGLKENALVNEARLNFYRKYPLRKDMTIQNVSVDFKNTYVFIYHQTTATFSAEIVELKPFELPVPFDGRFNGFYTSDSVFFFIQKPGQINRILFTDGNAEVGDFVVTTLNAEKNLSRIVLKPIKTNRFGFLCIVKSTGTRVYIAPEWVTN